MLFVKKKREIREDRKPDPVNRQKILPAGNHSSRNIVTNALKRPLGSAAENCIASTRLASDRVYNSFKSPQMRTAHKAAISPCLAVSC